MKVKIISASTGLWYASKIGQIFEVSDADKYGCYRIDGPNSRGILTGDAEVMVNEEKYVKITSCFSPSAWYASKIGQVFLVDTEAYCGMYSTKRPPDLDEVGFQDGGIMECDAEVFKTPPEQPGRFQFKVTEKHAKHSDVYSRTVGCVLWADITKNPEMYEVFAFKALPKSMVTPLEEVKRDVTGITEGPLDAVAIEVPAEKAVHSSGITFEMLQEETYVKAATALSQAALEIYGAVRVEFYKKNGDLRTATG